MIKAWKRYGGIFWFGLLLAFGALRAWQHDVVWMILDLAVVSGMFIALVITKGDSK